MPRSWLRSIGSGTIAAGAAAAASSSRRPDRPSSIVAPNRNLRTTIPLKRTGDVGQQPQRRPAGPSRSVCVRAHWNSAPPRARVGAAKAVDAVPTPFCARPGTSLLTPYQNSIPAITAVEALDAWFANAELSLSHIQRQMMAHKFAVSSVRCWPHHFDLSTLTTLPMRAAETTGYVGVGLSPGDEYYNEPYFYISVYPDPDSTMLPDLPKFGHWHTHEFTAAVMPAHRLLTAQDQTVETDYFLQAAVSAAIKLLS